MNFVSRTSAICMLILLLSASLLAQTTGSLKGQVTDPTGAVVGLLRIEDLATARRPR